LPKVEDDPDCCADDSEAKVDPPPEPKGVVDPAVPNAGLLLPNAGLLLPNEEVVAAAALPPNAPPVDEPDPNPDEPLDCCAAPNVLPDDVVDLAPNAACAPKPDAPPLCAVVEGFDPNAPDEAAAAPKPDAPPLCVVVEGFDPNAPDEAAAAPKPDEGFDPNAIVDEA